MAQFYRNIEKHPKRYLIIVCVFLAFFSCFSFPLFEYERPLDLMTLLVKIFAYYEAGMFFAGLFRWHPLSVLGLTAGLSALGMFARFLMEYGEVSNTYNFTALNITMTVVAVPLFVTAVYTVLAKLRKA